MFQCDDEERLNCLEKNSDAFLENASWEADSILGDRQFSIHYISSLLYS
jgi:hypothetical protein